jgi:peptidoglycan/LPS O-acetylase OafA/YrhL
MTGMRFVAALSIVLFHAIATSPALLPTLPSLYLDMGVSLFFVLSGYILQLSYRNLSSVK